MVIDANNPDHSGRYKVYVDGLDVTKDCFWADDEAGIARVYLRNEDNHYFLREDEPAQTVLLGRVTFEVVTQP